MSENIPVINAYPVTCEGADGIAVAEVILDSTDSQAPIAQVSNTKGGPVHASASGSFSGGGSAQSQSPRSPYNSALDTSINERGLKDFLGSKRWPSGLQNLLARNASKIPLRFFICDDSGSMAASDGKRLHGAGPQTKLLTCTRWAELTDALKFHVELARKGSMPTEFRMLNGAPPILIGASVEMDEVGASALGSIFSEGPGGATPLCRHIREIIGHITEIAPRLISKGQKAAVIIATDGESSDGDLAQALRPLRNLPVWVVVRLCTDDEIVVEYWNNIDSELELDMDVLDDFVGEASEVHAFNSFFSYAEPIHRIREFGIPLKEIDLLDEAKLSPEQMRVICSLIFNVPADDLPHPEIDWPGFLTAVESFNREQPQVWNPVTRSMQPWIQSRELRASYGKQSGCAVS